MGQKYHAVVVATERGGEVCKLFGSRGQAFDYMIDAARKEGADIAAHPHVRAGTWLMTRTGDYSGYSIWTLEAERKPRGANRVLGE